MILSAEITLGNEISDAAKQVYRLRAACGRRKSCGSKREKRGEKMKFVWLVFWIFLLAANVFAQQSNVPPTPAASPVPLPSPVETTGNAASNSPPPLKNLRYDEDFSRLRDATKRTDWLDRLKFIPLNRSKSWYLTLGGEMRQRYETYRNAGFGAGVQDADGYLLERYMLHADFHFGKRFRVFTQIKSGLLENRSGGSRAADTDKLDLHQAFADYTVFANDKNLLTVRAGRQEAEFGSSRLVAVREGANVRQSFDGVRLLIKTGGWQFSPWFLKPVTTRGGFFDDRTNNEQTFRGVYAARNLPKKLNGLLAVYFSELDSGRIRYDREAGADRRETVGARIAGKTGALDFNYEAVGQFGKFAGSDVRAWAIITDSGYTFSKTRLKPRLAVRFDATSGDENPSDGKMQTFNPLFASNVAYSGLVSLILPSNSTTFVPSLELSLSKKVGIKFDAAMFWRTSNRDALYGSRDAQRTGQLSRAKFVGIQPSAQIVYRLNRYLSWTTVFTHFFAGRFLRETPPAEDVDYFTSYLTFKF